MEYKIFAGRFEANYTGLFTSFVLAPKLNNDSRYKTPAVEIGHKFNMTGFTEQTLKDNNLELLSDMNDPSYFHFINKIKNQEDFSELNKNSELFNLEKLVNKANISEVALVDYSFCVDLLNYENKLVDLYLVTTPVGQTLYAKAENKNIDNIKGHIIEDYERITNNKIASNKLVRNNSQHAFLLEGNMDEIEIQHLGLDNLPCTYLTSRQDISIISEHNEHKDKDFVVVPL